MSITADSTRIDDAVIDGLRPQTRRYDVAVSDGLVLAVLPNGSKTWTWVYDGPGQPHRQTLGVYPEMSFEQARQALAAAAKTRRERGAPPAYVIRDGRIEPVGHPIEWKWSLAGALALAAGGVVLGWLLLGDGNSAPGDTADAPDYPLTAPHEPTSEALRLDRRLDADRMQPEASAPADPSIAGPSADSVPQSTQNPLASRGAIQPGSAPAPVPVQADTSPASATMPAAQAAAEPEPTQVAAAAPEEAMTQPLATPAATIAQEVVDTPAGALPVVARPKPSPALTEARASAEPPSEIIPSDTAPAATPAATSATVANATPKNASDLVVGARIRAGTDFEPGIDDDRVARAQITSAVVDREPVDTLGPVVTGNGEAIQTFAFFTELRSLAGQRVRHRWIADDRIEAEIPFDVGEAWRWRIFSSKRLLASMAGPWRVQVVTDDGAVIYDYAFEFRP